MILNTRKILHESSKINKFWEGDKFDHDGAFEMPIVCNTCRQLYRAWPNSNPSVLLKKGGMKIKECINLFVRGVSHEYMPLKRCVRVILATLHCSCTGMASKHLKQLKRVVEL